MSSRTDHNSRRLKRAAHRAVTVTLAAAAACVALPAAAHAAPPLGWSPTGQIDSSGLSSVSCSSEALCVAVDHAGNALSTSDPNSLVPSWSAPSSIDPGASLNSLACAAPSTCVAVDGLGAALASTNPREGGWSRIPIDGGRTLTGVTCPSASLCVAVDEAGNVLSTEHPGSSWSKPEAIDAGAGRRLLAVSCASASLCVAVDSVGNALASASPTGGAAAWHLRSIAPSRELVSVSCTPAGFCVALDSQGNALASQNPAASTPTWSFTPIDAGGHPTAISCASSGLCVAVDDRGLALASDEPLAPVPNWSESSDGSVLTSISCLAAGFCVAGDPSGRSFTARVPPPEVASATPSVITATSATLAGVVNPHDATIGSCRFEYGTTLPYSQSIPCATPPAATNAAQLVTALLAGLSANTLYHYRVVASSAIGSAAGADATFTTAVSSLVALVLPHPSISGTPAVGQRLACHANTPSGAVTQLTYAWLRDLIAIPSSSASTYVVKGADTAHHLQCQVTATNAGGSATARSSFVTIPVQGIPASAGETLVRAARFSRGKLNVPIVCSPRAISGCRLLLRVTVALRHTTVTLARVRTRMARGEHRTVAVALNRTGKRLLAARHRVPAKLTVSGTVIGVIESTLAQQKVLLGTRSRGARTAQASPPPQARTSGVLAPTPYMGWDSYFAFGGRYSEATVLEQASELLYNGLARQGYRYVWLDVGWWHGKRDASGQISVSSSQWPHGMAWLARTLHAAGLLVGLYTD
ncbi:MAG: alpha-galactosidase, partial [Solirubrobacteraceae bacterium]|nr:alpha-galactosidase [Solirubrobacteraceae bacterium]